MGIEQAMSIEDNYVKSYHNLWVTDSCLKLFSPLNSGGIIFKASLKLDDPLKSQFSI